MFPASHALPSPDSCIVCDVSPELQAVLKGDCQGCSEGQENLWSFSLLVYSLYLSPRPTTAFPRVLIPSLGALGRDTEEIQHPVSHGNPTSHSLDGLGVFQTPQELSS